MWVITPSGFYSTVAHAELPEFVIVRARARADIEAFATFARGLTGESGRIVYGTTDYPYRVIVQRNTWGAFLARETSALDYGNFKELIGSRDTFREHVYERVWLDLMALELREVWPDGKEGYSRRFPFPEAETPEG